MSSKEKQVSEPWQNKCSTITEALSYMLGKEVLVDAVLSNKKGHRIFAHKLVFSVWSPVFAEWVTEADEKRMLSIHFTEDRDVLNTIIKYLYSWSSEKCFNKLSNEKLIQAIEFSRRYELEQVYQKCVKLLKGRSVGPRNVLEFFDYGLKENFVDVMQKCIKVIQHKGIAPNISKEGLSLETIVSILKLDRIAVPTEADLLSLAISWLSYAGNKCYKSEVLSCIDLASIKWKEYGSVLKKFPDFFSDSEVSAILLGLIRQNNNLFPEWYRPSIRSVAEKTCSLCISVDMKLKVSTVFAKKCNHQRDSTKFELEFMFEINCSGKGMLLKIGLGFGPGDIPEDAFILQCCKNGAGPWKRCLINCTFSSSKYTVLFEEPVAIQSGDSLKLKFYFIDSVKDSIRVILLNAVEKQKINRITSKDCVQVKLASKAAFYVSKDDTAKFLISSLKVSFCGHDAYLVRKCVASDDTIGVNNDKVTERGGNATKDSYMDIDIKQEEENDSYFETRDVKQNVKDDKILYENTDFKGNIISNIEQGEIICISD